MNDTGLLLLRPECLRSGNAVPMVAHLNARYGMQVVGIRVLRMNRRQFRALYAHRLALWGRTAWLHEKLMTANPSAAVLLEGDPQPYPDLCSLLHAIKGPSLALARAPDSLRQRFGRQSSFHSVVHSPEDRDSLAAAIRLFFEERPAAGARIPRPVWSALLETEPPRGASVFEAAVHTARRVTAAAALRGAAASGLLARLARLLGYLKGKPYCEQRDIFLEFARRSESALGRIPALPFLFGCRSLTAARARKLFARFERDNVPVSEQLQELLYAGALADWNPGAVWQGSRLYPYPGESDS
ncbi:MAG TPA: nucleoside-diphosphate kinase [Bryobacteraceae bacterium]|nr:nucleoside-diphosphate kinase [Bryobacteraceae bacterium]